MSNIKDYTSYDFDTFLNGPTSLWRIRDEVSTVDDVQNYIGSNNSDTVQAAGLGKFGSTMTKYVIFPKTSKYGMKVDHNSPTFGWVDLLGYLVVKSAGANDPVLTTYRNNLKEYMFSQVIVNEMFIAYHMPHDYLAGSDIYIHTHWSQITVDTGGAAGVPGNVKWYFDVSYAKGHEQAAFSSPITTSVVDTASGTQYQHILSEVQLSAASPSASQIDSDNLEPDGIILVRVYRNPADAADTLDQNPFLHYVDIHYQTTGIGTKQKAPNFYI